MNNTLKIKKQVSAYITKEELKNIKFFVISFDNTSISEDKNSFKITKNQYTQSEVSAYIKKENLKFPLSIREFNNEEEIIKSKNTDKINSLSVIKMNNHIFPGKKNLTSFLTNFSQIYFKFNNIMLSMIRFLKLLKYLNENNEKLKTFK